MEVSKATSRPVVGDPGLLVPFLWPKCGRACSPSCDVCLLLHHNDGNDEGILKEQKDNGACFLGANGVSYPPERVTEFLLNCKLVVSSSLHGLIVAEAFGVKARWLSIGASARTEGVFKYQDYYTGSGRDPDVARPAKSLEEAIRLGGAPPIPREYNISELIEAFPYDDWGGCPQIPRDGREIGTARPCL
jgi:pyruvyltransferase